MGFVLSVLDLVNWSCPRGLGALPLGAQITNLQPLFPDLNIQGQIKIIGGGGLGEPLERGRWALGLSYLLSLGLLIDLLLGGWVVFLWREVWGSLFESMGGYGSLCSVRGSWSGSTSCVLCLGLVFLFQCLFLFCWVQGPSCPFCWSGFCSCSGVSSFTILGLVLDLVLGDDFFFLTGCLGELLCEWTDLGLKVRLTTWRSCSFSCSWGQGSLFRAGAFCVQSKKVHAGEGSSNYVLGFGCLVSSLTSVLAFVVFLRKPLFC